MSSLSRCPLRTGPYGWLDVPKIIGPEFFGEMRILSHQQNREITETLAEDGVVELRRYDPGDGTPSIHHALSGGGTAHFFFVANSHAPEREVEVMLRQLFFWRGSRPDDSRDLTVHAIWVDPERTEHNDGLNDERFETGIPNPLPTWRMHAATRRMTGTILRPRSAFEQPEWTLPLRLPSHTFHKPLFATTVVMRALEEVWDTPGHDVVGFISGHGQDLGIGPFTCTDGPGSFELAQQLAVVRHLMGFVPGVPTADETWFEKIEGVPGSFRYPTSSRRYEVVGDQGYRSGDTFGGWIAAETARRGILPPTMVLWEALHWMGIPDDRHTGTRADILADLAPVYSKVGPLMAGFGELALTLPRTDPFVRSVLVSSGKKPSGWGRHPLPPDDVPLSPEEALLMMTRDPFTIATKVGEARQMALRYGHEDNPIVRDALALQRELLAASTNGGTYLSVPLPHGVGLQMQVFDLTARIGMSAFGRGPSPTPVAAMDPAVLTDFAQQQGLLRGFPADGLRLDYLQHRGAVEVVKGLPIGPVAPPQLPFQRTSLTGPELR